MRNGLIEKVICMTEKRYKRLVSSIDYYYCIDTNDDKGLTEDDMLNRLNEQDKEIQKLKQKVNGLKSELTIWKEDANEHIQEINKLFEENEKLKQELASFEQVSFTNLCDRSRTTLYMKKENGDSE